MVARICAFFGIYVLLATTTAAQSEEAPSNKAERQAAIDEMAHWVKGPTTAKMGDLAEIRLPAGYRFCSADDTKKLMELMENPTTGAEQGLVAPNDFSWFMVFEFDECGYVKDDDRDQLDADAMLKSMKEANVEGNKERRRRGWTALDLVGWEQQPAYDPQTNNLTWATRLRSEGEDTVNHNTRLLGRRGVMEVTLVVDPPQLATVLPAANKLIAGYQFSSGSRYGDFRSGDHIAEYGLTALVTGGAVAVALKTGLLQKFWKLIVLAIVAVGMGAKKILGALFGRRQAA